MKELKQTIEEQEMMIENLEIAHKLDQLRIAELESLLRRNGLEVPPADPLKLKAS